MFFTLVLVMVSLGVCTASECYSFDEPGTCFGNNCIWYTKKCVPCEEVDRTKTCKNKRVCEWDDESGKCFTRPEYVPTVEPTLSPTMSPTTPQPTGVPTEYGRPCYTVLNPKPCSALRHCKWNRKSKHCCDLPDPNAFCRTRKTKTKCTNQGCRWDKETKQCI